MRWTPRTGKGRVTLAVGVSLICHSLLVLVCFNLRSALPSAGEPVERRIGAPSAYPTISMSFIDSPAPTLPVPAKTRAVAKKSPATPTKNVDAVSVDGHAGNSANTVPTTDAAVHVGAPAIAPLHGKIQKPDFTVVYVLDRSGSMGRDRKLTHAVATLKASLQQLSPDVRFQIVVYDSRADVLRIGGSSDVVPATPANLAEAERQLDALIGEGSSRHLEGLRTGLGLRPDLLILLTDADELTAKDVQLIKKWNAKGTAIHAVLIGSADESARSLRELAGPTHVHFIQTPSLH
jgi:hypothetical protein